MNVVDLDVWQGMMTAREIIFSLVPMLCCFFAARVLLHYFQLESYQFPGYFRTLNRNRKHAFLPGICSAAVCLILFTLQNAWYTHALQSPETPPSAVMIWLITLGLLAVAVLAGIGIGKVFSEKHAKKAFVFTGRMKRLMVMLALGADLYTVSKLLGHADVKMTQVYAKIINKKKDEAVNLVNGLFH